MNKYELDASRTEPQQLDVIKKRIDTDTLKLLNNAFSELIVLNEKIDSLKKYIFYGKQNTVVLETSKRFFLSEDYLKSDEGIRILHACLGLTTEVGELFEALVKVNDSNHIDSINVLEEAGDLFWYLAIIANVFGSSFEAIQNTNIEKLKKRFPNKFEEKEAINRDVDSERKILNKIERGDI